MKPSQNVEVITDASISAGDSVQIEDLNRRYDALLVEIDLLGQTMDAILSSVNALAGHPEVQSREP